MIPNAIDADRLQVAQPGAVRCAFRNRLGLEPDDLVGLFVGHNFWLKGLKPLLHGPGRAAGDAIPARGRSTCSSAAAGTARAVPPDGPTARAWSGRSTSLGFVPDIRACYWASDFFVSPTYYDPCSLVVLEALACGLPVITTACNGAGELMTDGREGFVIPAPDALDELVAAPRPHGRRRGPTADGRRTPRGWAGRSTFDHHVARLVRVFEEVAATQGRTAAATRRLGVEARHPSPQVAISDRGRDRRDPSPRTE